MTAITTTVFEEGGARRKLRVLVADDEYVISRCITFMLKKEGYECRAVSDGDAALEAIRQERPDLVILDLDMPKRNGFEVCKALRADPALADLHVLVLTAKGQPMARDWRSRIQADSFMLKPFDPRSLIRHVASIFAKRAEDAAAAATAAAGESCAQASDAHDTSDDAVPVGCGPRDPR